VIDPEGGGAEGEAGGDDKHRNGDPTPGPVTTLGRLDVDRGRKQRLVVVAEIETADNAG
jgi:hypothetical protein